MTTAPKRITPDTDDATRLNRIREMQRDLASLLSVNWGDVDDGIKGRVLTPWGQLKSEARE
jgi:hypothetical protein